MVHSRTFKFSVYLTVFAGVLAIVSAEQMLFYLVLFLIASVLSWFLVDKTEIAFLPRRPALFLMLACLVFALLDKMFVSKSTLLALEHYLVLTLIVKLFQRKTKYVLTQIYVLSFLLVLNSAALTENISFLVVLIYYLTISVFSLSLFFIKSENHRFVNLRDRYATRFDASGGMDLFLSRQYFHFTLGLSILVFLLTVTFFLALPRFHTKPVPGESLADQVDGADGTEPGAFDVPVPIGDSPSTSGLPQPVTEFATGIDFQSMGGPMKLDTGVAVRVRLLRNGRPLPVGTQVSHLYFKGIHINLPGNKLDPAKERKTLVLDADDGQRDGKVMLGPSALPVSSMEVQYEILPNGTKGMLLVLDQPVSVNANRLYQIEPNVGYLLPNSGQGAINPVIQTYSAISRLGPSPDASSDLGAARHPDPLYTKLPTGYNKIALRNWFHSVLSKQAANDESDYLKARAVERQMRNVFEYSTDTGQLRGRNPVENFLFHSKKGWCEHFASGMVFALRSAGLSCRVVGGFRGGEWDHETGKLNLRRADAHAWVEVYFENAGWIRFDPTPGDEQLIFEAGDAPEAVLDEMDIDEDANDIADADTEEELEDEWVDDRGLLEKFFIGFDSTKQKRMMEGVFSGPGRALNNAMQTLNRWSGGLFQFNPDHTTIVGFALLLLGLGTVIGTYLVLRRGQTDRHLDPSLLKSGRGSIRLARFYSEFLKSLQPFGIRRSRQQTAKEFADYVQQRFRHQLSGVDGITDCYHRVRFGGEELEYKELKQLKTDLKKIKTHLNAILEKKKQDKAGN